MKRRHFLTNVAISTTTATALVSCQNKDTETTVKANDLPEVTWKMVTSWPKSLDTIFGGAETVCEKVREMSGGKFKITPYAAGEVVPGLEVMDAVQNGTVECGHTASYYYVGKNPALAFATSVPFGLNAQQQNAWLYHAGGLDAIHKIYAEFNIISFPAGNTGAQMGGWFKKEIKSLADLKGLKMRIPGLGGEVMSKLGVNVQVLPPGEIFLALDRGAIDAAEWVGPYDDEKLGLNKAATYYYYPGWWEPGPTLDILINISPWEKLPPEYQQMVITASKEANINMLAQYNVLNQQTLPKLLASGTKLAAYPQDVLEEAEKISFQLYEDNASKDAGFKSLYEEWKKFRDGVIQWNKINELSYANFVSKS